MKIASEPSSIHPGKSTTLTIPMLSYPAKGVEFKGPPQKQPWGTFVMMTDSEGNQIVLSTR